MDYEKKYNDLVSRLNKAKNDEDVCDDRFCVVIDEILLESNESEDEKTRKHIIELVKQSSNILCKQTQDAMIAYLEKQKESTWTEEDDIFERNILPRILNPSGWTLEQNNADKHYLEEFVGRQKNKSFEKQKDRKPVITGDDVAWIDDLKHDLEHPEELDESEDERMLMAVISGINELKTNCGWEEIDGINMGHILAWLEKQKEQKPDNDRYMEGYMRGIGEQKSAEWSEEDDYRIRWIISLLTTMREKGIDDRFGDSVPDDIPDMIAWLKSLRPQPHWKPSEEQMEALDNAQMELYGTEYNEGLCSLIDDLKKL